MGKLNGSGSFLSGRQVIDVSDGLFPLEKTIAIPVNNRYLNGILVEVIIERFSKSLKSEFDGGVEGEILLPFRFKELHHCIAPFTHSTRLIGLVGSTRVCFVEMDTVAVDTGYQEGGTKWANTSILGERLFEIAYFLGEDIHWNSVVVGDTVDLALSAGSSDELPCVSNKTGCCESYVVVNLVDLID